jgi:hypothetical protein
MGSWAKGQYAASAQKWATNYAASGANLKSGVAAPRRDPTAAAVAQQQAMVSGFNAAVSSGMWAQNLQRAGLAGWQSGMTQFANTGMQAAATKGQSRVAAYAQSYGPQVMQQVQSLPAKGPAGTNQQRSAQLNAWAHSQRGKNRAAWRGTTTG